ncbi:MAG: membrane protein insertion efficiency factor YidD [Rhodocyclaceae bacterium]|nr:membrane protein insertion efficiency factor YidD [Rhodocyclaceae bacterium]
MLSPYTEFRCAHRVLHGGWSCSEFGPQAVLRFGVIRFVALQRRRFVRCAQAHAALQAMAEDGGANFKVFPWRACVTRRRVESASDCCCPCFL